MDHFNLPELLTNARDLDEVKELAEAGADAVIVGHQHFGLRVTGDFTLQEIEEALVYLNKSNKKLYVLINAIFHNERLIELPSYLKALEEMGVHGIICGEPSIFPILAEINSSLSVHWNPETLATNYETLKYWQSKGISRAVLSNELSLDAIIEIKKELSLPVEVQVQGMTCIFQSKRKLVRNYYQHIQEEEEANYLQEKNLHLRQFKEDDSHYPIFEDCNGTHIMSNEDLCMIEHLLGIIDGNIDCLRINGLLKSRHYNKKIVSIYKEAIQLCVSNPAMYEKKKNEYVEEIIKMQPDERKLDTGFYFKEQIY